MSLFYCPICKSELVDNGKSMMCKANHCFDKSKYGYVNLLISQKSSASHHGDDKLMVKARKDFLDKGYYSHLQEALSKIVLKYACDSCVILDAGCGEGYYLSSIFTLLDNHSINAKIGGIDISKDALIYASKRERDFSLAVASVFDMPLKNECADIILNVFSPFAKEEYERVLKKGGYLFRVIPLENHLLALKEAIYDKPYKNDVPPDDIYGFDIVEKAEIKKGIRIDGNEDILSLFMMTPYYYKTGKSDQQKLNTVNYLSVETEFMIIVYRKSL